MDGYGQKFCESLKAYFDREYGNRRGAIKEFAEHLNLSHGQTSNMLRGIKGSTEGERRRIAKRIGLNYDDMIGVSTTSTTGLSPEADAELIHHEPSNNIIEIEHFNIIKRFQNKELAKSINEQLLELEALNPDELIEVEALIKFKIGRYDRRKSDQPDKIPETGDRRKAAG